MAKLSVLVSLTHLASKSIVWDAEREEEAGNVQIIIN